MSLKGIGTEMRGKSKATTQGRYDGGGCDSSYCSSDGNSSGGRVVRDHGVSKCHIAGGGSDEGSDGRRRR